MDKQDRHIRIRLLVGPQDVASSRSSRHQSKNRPILFARSRSSSVLKPFTVFAVTESLSSIFHLDTTRREKNNFLISLLHRHLTSFNECTRVLSALSIWNISVNGIAEKPCAILKTSIKSARFRRLPKSTVPVSATNLHIVMTSYHLRESLLHFFKKLFILLIMWRPKQICSIPDVDELRSCRFNITSGVFTTTVLFIKPNILFACRQAWLQRDSTFNR